MTLYKTINRFQSLDLLRGIVMILMALDHVRFFFHADVPLHNPENLLTTTPALFFTRWVTHFCATVFIFLVGISAFLIAEKKGKRETFRFLISRGIFLIILELTVFRFAWNGNFSTPEIDLLVIWAIGVSMIFLAFAARYLSYKILFIIGLTIVLGHNLLDGIKADPSTFAGKVWILLHVSAGFKLTDSISVFVLYPLLPYFGIVLSGWGFGKIFSNTFDALRRRKILYNAGIAGLIIFILLRFSNFFGDPQPWTVQRNFIYSALSFIKTTKYPTSLLYILMTISPALLLLFATDKKIPKIFSPVIEIGQVPMFYYLIHLFLIMGIAKIGGGFNTYTLSGVYTGWLIVVVILYFLCRFYRRYKFSHPEKKWLSYL